MREHTYVVVNGAGAFRIGEGHTKVMVNGAGELGTGVRTYICGYNFINGAAW